MSTLVFLIVKPLLTALLASVFLAYIFYPFYGWLVKRIKSKSLSSLIVCFIIIVLLLAPLFFVLNTITKEAYIGYLTSKQKILAVSDLFEQCDVNKNPLCGLVGYMGDFLNEPKVRYHLESTIERVTSYVVDSASDLVFSIPKFVLNFFPRPNRLPRKNPNPHRAVKNPQSAKLSRVAQIIVMIG